MNGRTQVLDWPDVAGVFEELFDVEEKPSAYFGCSRDDRMNDKQAGREAISGPLRYGFGPADFCSIVSGRAYIARETRER